jgi:hypothetical protein
MSPIQFDSEPVISLVFFRQPGQRKLRLRFEDQPTIDQRIERLQCFVGV